MLAAIAFSFGAHAASPAAKKAAPAKPQSADQTNTQSTTASSTANDKNAEKKAKKLQAVTVTGSLLPRVEYQTMVPIQTVDIKADVNAGAFSTADMLQTTAVAAGSTQINNQFSGFLVAGGTGIQTIDLRGLGSQRTLVLLDGQRPGPAGTRGQTGAGFDLNVIPSVILQRIEIVKDGSSSLYGSDAIAGVVNLITKTRMDKPEFTSSMSFPVHGGGDKVSASMGTGWNFSNGNILLAAQFQEQLPLANYQRSFLRCPQDRVWGTNGQRIDRKDMSITAGTPLSGCNNLYADTIINYFDFNQRYNPTTDGSTVGPFPGFAPRPYPPLTYANGGTAGYTDVTNFPFAADGWAINRNRNSSLYASSRFNFGSVGWTNQFLYDHRQTDTRGFRQFFPIVAGPGGYYLPIMPYPSNSQVKVDYYYLRTELDGAFGDSDWSWTVNATHSHSKGEYSHVGIDARISGDLSLANNTLSQPLVNYYDPGILNGSKMGELVNAVGILSAGNTVYTQSTANAVINGSLFSLPAGDVSVAVGAEYRKYAINDQPGPASINGWEWGYTSAQVTKGNDHVGETYAELGIPVVADVPGFENLAFDVSARHFKYGSIAKAGTVWKYGLNWQLTNSWRLRGTIGTSYRAPGLYELYLGNQSGFQGQLNIDPCINWATTPGVSPLIQKNCAAAGIPGDYAGGAASAKVISSGGKGYLNPETSRAKSVGVVFTPTAEFNVALDYFDYHIRGEIATLTANDVVTGCYNTPIYPNSFCGFFDRNPASDPSAPFAITDVRLKYININSERTRGYDLQANYNHDFGPFKLVSQLQVVYTTEDTQQLFSTKAASGFASTNFVGNIGRPKTTGLASISLQRGHWSYNWQGQFVSSTYYPYASTVFTYQGYPNAVRDIKAGWQLRHNVSVGYHNDKWGVIFGVRNLFDKAPDQVSSGLVSTRGNTPIAASQYDWFGRTLFVRANYKF